MKEIIVDSKKFHNYLGIGTDYIRNLIEAEIHESREYHELILTCSFTVFWHIKQALGKSIIYANPLKRDEFYLDSKYGMTLIRRCWALEQLWELK